MATISQSMAVSRAALSSVPWLACPEAANNFWGLANGLIALFHVPGQKGGAA